MAQRTCSVDDCEAKHFARGFCSMHYSRIRRHGSPDLKWHPQGPVCSVENCDRETSAKGFCHKHYLRWRKHGDALFEFEYAKRLCELTGCSRPHVAKGLCALHYNRIRLTGTLRGRLEVIDGMRLCGKCGQDTPLDQFTSRAWCRDCTNAYMRERNHVRRARLRDARVEEFSHEEIFERDAWTCQLCMAPLNRSAEWPAADFPSIDHIVPLSLGGPHARDNVQAACLRCNSSKGNRVALTSGVAS